MSPRAECRDDQCLPCVCVVLVTRTGSMGVHPYSKETRVPKATAWIPRRPRGLLLDDISPIFWNVAVGSCCELGGHEPTGHFIVIIISASTAHATAHATPHALTGMASHSGV